MANANSSFFRWHKLSVWIAVTVVGLVAAGLIYDKSENIAIEGAIPR